MQSLGEDASPLMLRIKLRQQPAIDADTVESIRQLSEKKLSARKCSLLQALLIHKALPLLEKESTTCNIVSLLDDTPQPCDVSDDTPAMQCTPPRRHSRCDKRNYDDLPDGKPNLNKARRRLSDGSCEAVQRRSIGNGPCLD